MLEYHNRQIFLPANQSQ